MGTEFEDTYFRTTTINSFTDDIDTPIRQAFSHVYKNPSNPPTPEQKEIYRKSVKEFTANQFKLAKVMHVNPTLKNIEFNTNRFADYLMRSNDKIPYELKIELTLTLLTESFNSILNYEKSLESNTLALWKNSETSCFQFSSNIASENSIFYNAALIYEYTNLKCLDYLNFLENNHCDKHFAQLVKKLFDYCHFPSEKFKQNLLKINIHEVKDADLFSHYYSNCMKYYMRFCLIDLVDKHRDTLFSDFEPEKGDNELRTYVYKTIFGQSNILTYQ